ncbi:MAG: chaperonin [Candidatus Magnetoglobus multicellularis str. Araruama]|uniref:Chaperonin n=1 Tax=Candidatus Magnetoglobus multicellularis str. Araruama TaxID=890399 RepID=A0A1V1NWA6_9BACT|nr:MAG: chaperonin [Candidatus Magnetoglobus multicellularis str. Araruama]
MSKPCGCGNDCQKKFTVSEIIDAREDFRQMSWAEQHSFIIGKLQSFIHSTAHSKSARTTQSRKRQRFDYCITADRPVCRKYFLLYYGESIDRLKRRQKYLIEIGTVPPAHGNTGKKPKHACSQNTIEAVLKFISNFTSIHGLPDPGRDLRAGKGKLTIYLPTIMNYMAIHRIYRKSMEGSDNIRVVEYHAFRKLWVDNFPHIVFSKTKSDLCMTCEEHKKQINITVAAGNEEEKLEALEKAREHLLYATKERTHYRQCIEISKQSYSAMIKNPKKSEPEKMHYSWDFAQQMHYPYEDHQVGPIYFKTPRVAQLFGVCCEALPRQINYLIDEADIPGKGADTVISILHHFFACYGLGERNLLLTADNCKGQNKNNAVLHYMLYRTIAGLHDKIDWSFMLVGHTKFSPDAYFGLLKKKYRRSRIYTYRQLVDVINTSTVKGCNVCHPYRKNDGNASFRYREWIKWLSKYFRKLPGISNYHHFSMDSSNPGVVIAKRYVDSKQEIFELLKKIPTTQIY